MLCFLYYYSLARCGDGAKESEDMWILCCICHLVHDGDLHAENKQRGAQQGHGFVWAAFGGLCFWSQVSPLTHLNLLPKPWLLTGLQNGIIHFFAIYVAQKVKNAWTYSRGGIKGCNGAGLEDYPKWFIDQGGFGAHEHAYHYIGNLTSYQCLNRPLWASGSQAVKYYVDYKCDEQKLMQYIFQFGAVMVGMNATEGGFNNYATGIWSNCRWCGKLFWWLLALFNSFHFMPGIQDQGPQWPCLSINHSIVNRLSHRPSKYFRINHAVTLFGYGSINGVDFWMGKNSWGKSWGEKGFFRIRRGVDMCGIEQVRSIIGQIDMPDSLSFTLAFR